MQNQDVLQKLIPIYSEIETLLLDAKQILTEAKDAGLDHSLLAKVAKAKAKDALKDLEDKTSELLDFIKEVT